MTSFVQSVVGGNAAVFPMGSVYDFPREIQLSCFNGILPHPLDGFNHFSGSKRLSPKTLHLHLLAEPIANLFTHTSFDLSYSLHQCQNVIKKEYVAPIEYRFSNFMCGLRLIDFGELFFR